MVLIAGATFSAMGASKLLPVYNAIFTCRIVEYFFIVVQRDFEVLHLIQFHFPCNEQLLFIF